MEDNKKCKGCGTLEWYEGSDDPNQLTRVDGFYWCISCYDEMTAEPDDEWVVAYRNITMHDD